jgi:hypothetical protein
MRALAVNTECPVSPTRSLQSSFVMGASRQLTSCSTSCRKWTAYGSSRALRA